MPRWSRSHRESRARNLRDLDFLALAVVLGLLALLFRRTEGWLHQHIFKVGWLLTNSFQVTTVIYYIAFLPGIALRELTLWLAARILNVRASGALRLPEEEDISHLRLTFIRLAPETSAFKQRLISLCPLATGLTALWAISATLLQGNELMALATPGSVTELGAAVTALTHRANFWLWLYIVFTIANRCFPATPMPLSGRRKAALMLALPMLMYGLWRASDAANPAIALAIEGLLRGLALILAQITLLNFAGLLVLGGLEAVIERISSRSASFREGRMITGDGRETAQPKSGPRHARPNADAASQTRQLKSIYDLKLPIPGPPGREPVSRQAVAVMSPDPATIPSRDKARREQPIPGPLDAQAESARERSIPKRDDACGDATPGAAGHDPVAPFARPFAALDPPDSADDHWDEIADESGGETFARPFAMRTRSAQPASDPAKAESASEEKSPAADAARRQSGMTRPAPKPSQKFARDSGEAKAPDPDELIYEDLDESDVYDRGDDS